MRSITICLTKSSIEEVTISPLYLCQNPKNINNLNVTGQVSEGLLVHRPGFFATADAADRPRGSTPPALQFAHNRHNHNCEQAVTSSPDSSPYQHRRFSNKTQKLATI